MSEMKKLEMEALDELAGGDGLGEKLMKRYKNMSEGRKAVLRSALGVATTMLAAEAVDQLAFKGKGTKYLGGKIRKGASAVAGAVKSWMPGRKNAATDEPDVEVITNANETDEPKN